MISQHTRQIMLTAGLTASMVTGSVGFLIGAFLGLCFAHALDWLFERFSPTPPKPTEDEAIINGLIDLQRMTLKRLELLEGQINVLTSTEGETG